MNLQNLSAIKTGFRRLLPVWIYVLNVKDSHLVFLRNYPSATFWRCFAQLVLPSGCCRVFFISSSISAVLRERSGMALSVFVEQLSRSGFFVRSKRCGFYLDEKDSNYISVIPIVFVSSLRFYYAC